MGIFGVNMPLLYGEGMKAFTRLRQEIVRMTDDESIFASKDGELAENAKGNDECGRIFVPLNCGRPSGSAFQQLAVELEHRSRNNYARTSPEQFFPTKWPNQMDIASWVYVRPVNICKPSGEWISVDMYLSFPVIPGFSILITYDCLPENHCRGLNEICVRIRFKKDLSVAALLLKGDGQLFGMLFHAAECVLSISLILFSTVQNCAQEMNKYKYSLRYPLPSHVPLAYPVIQQSQDGCWVSVDLKRGGRMPRKRCYFVNLVVPERHRG